MMLIFIEHDLTAKLSLEDIFVEFKRRNYNQHRLEF